MLTKRACQREDCESKCVCVCVRVRARVCLWVCVEAENCACGDPDARKQKYIQIHSRHAPQSSAVTKLINHLLQVMFATSSTCALYVANHDTHTRCRRTLRIGGVILCCQLPPRVRRFPTVSREEAQNLKNTNAPKNQTSPHAHARGRKAEQVRIEPNRTATEP